METRNIRDVMEGYDEQWNEEMVGAFGSGFGVDLAEDAYTGRSRWKIQAKKQNVQS